MSHRSQFYYSLLLILVSIAISLAVLIFGHWTVVTVIGIILLARSVVSFLAVRQAFANCHFIDNLTGFSRRVQIVPAVSHISTARNESFAIESAVKSWLSTNYSRYSIICIDDVSSDDTLLKLNNLCDKDERLRILESPFKIKDWIRKSSALWQAVGITPLDTRWILFTDADIHINPSTVSKAVSYAESRGIDFLTCIPKSKNKTFFESLMLADIWERQIRLIGLSLMGLGPPLVFGIGGFILVKKSAYLFSGGHSKYPNSHPEDNLLARAVAESGFHLGVLFSNGEVSFRYYTNPRDILVGMWKKHLVALNFYRKRAILKTINIYFEEVFPLFAVMLLFDSSAVLIWLVIYLVTYLKKLKLSKISTSTKLTLVLYPVGSLVKLGIQLFAIIFTLIGKKMTLDGRFTEIL